VTPDGIDGAAGRASSNPEKLAAGTVIGESTFSPAFTPEGANALREYCAPVGAVIVTAKPPSPAVLTATQSAWPAAPIGQASTAAPATALPFRVTLPASVTSWVPLPVSAIVCGLPDALSAYASCAVRAPVAPGVKASVVVQAAPAAIVWPAHVSPVIL
jgi:hypothetical protein